MSEFFRNALKERKNLIIAFDPGETTGACVFRGPDLLDARQLPTKPVTSGADLCRNYIDCHREDGCIVVCEDYRVYSWKAQDHSWSPMHTSRLIGALEYICYTWPLGRIPLVFQMAQQAKGFCTDQKLQAWGFYQTGMKHARDAIRHACYYQLFEIAQVHKRGG